MAPPPCLTVVSPVYQAEGLVAELVRQVVAAAATVADDFEVILVDDGSRDGSWARIAQAVAREPRVKGLRLTRNFGQHAAIRAGLDQAAGDYVAVMDCDLQDDPAYLPVLFGKAREGYDIVLTRRRRRQNWLRRVLSEAFFCLYNLVAEHPASDRGIGGYSLISRRAVGRFQQVHDRYANYLLTLSWIEGRRTVVPVEARPRFAGRSSYTPISLLRVAVNVLARSSTIGLYVCQIFDRARRRPIYRVEERLNCPPPPSRSG